MFCPRCGSLLMPKRSNGREKIVCSCGHEQHGVAGMIRSKVDDSRGEIAVIEKEEKLPVTSIVCPTCGHKEAFFWLQQTRAGDEPETRFYRCCSCSHTWREYT